MAASILIAFLALLPVIISYLVITKHKRPLIGHSNRRLPPGDLGLPIIGHSLSFLRAMRNNTAEKWLHNRINRYGPVSKLSLFGAPTVFLTGPTANRFVFVNDALAMKQPEAIPRILGKRNIVELVGEDHRRVRGAVAQFLKPEMLKMYVRKIDELVTRHIHMYWIEKRTVKVLPLMKSLTFDIICSLLFGLERSGPTRESLSKDFRHMIEGVWAIPVNLPFTVFNRSLRASASARKVLTKIIREKKAMLERGQYSPSDDLIDYLISLRGETGEGMLSEEEIVDNALLILIAGHDTSSILMTFMVRHLANDPVTLTGVVHEQEEIANSKAPGETLDWDDLAKMKYTWRVALETLRMIPPVFGNFRKTLKDIEFDGYLIPKGWQVFWASSITHMDPSIFHEPTKFDPARFEKQSSIPPYCFVGFGAGPRICPGNEFARIETLVFMHYLVTQFSWKLCCKENTFRRDPMPSPLHGLPIELELKRPLVEG